MLIELVGPPGAGKSTTVALLDRLMAAEHPRVMPYAEYEVLNGWSGERAFMRLPDRARWRGLVPAMLRFPRLTLRLVCLALLHGKPVGRRVRKAQRVLAHAQFVTHLHERFPDRVIVLHEGVAHFLWSLVIESSALRGIGSIERLLADYYASIAPALVVLRIDDEDASRRVFGRESKGRFNRESKPEKRSEFARWLDYHHRIVSRLPASLERFEVDASAGPEDVALQVHAAVQKAMRSALGG